MARVRTYTNQTAQQTKRTKSKSKHHHCTDPNDHYYS
jgi:hypothetical protein